MAKGLEEVKKGNKFVVNCLIQKNNIMKPFRSEPPSLPL